MLNLSSYLIKINGQYATKCIFRLLNQYKNQQLYVIS